jgi:TolA-binding protein
MSPKPREAPRPHRPAVAWWRWTGRFGLAALALAAGGAYVIQGPKIRWPVGFPALPETSIVAIPSNRSSGSSSPDSEPSPAPGPPSQSGPATRSSDHPIADSEPGSAAQRLAVDALAEGRLEEAAARYQALARQYPDDPALVHAARVLSRQAARIGSSFEGEP